jgi:hypothetical protein
MAIVMSVLAAAICGDISAPGPRQSVEEDIVLFTDGLCGLFRVVRDGLHIWWVVENKSRSVTRAIDYQRDGQEVFGGD